VKPKLRYLPFKIFLIFASLLILRVYFSYLNYLDFTSKKYQNIEALVINQYKKKNYYVLKLRANNVTFYTTSKEDLKNILNEKINLTIVTKTITFYKYLFGFYAPSFNLKLIPVEFLDFYIEKQHENKDLANLFKALFFGKSIPFFIREKLSSLGISHLFALSGLHLAFISMFLYFLFYPVYSVIHKRFPYRNRYIDLGIIILIFEFLYLCFSGFAPSLLRAFILEIILFLYLIYLQNPLKEEILLMLLFFSFIFFEKVLSIGYFLSFLGVFYIYLFFRYFKPTIINTIILSFYMFLMMNIFSHYFFGEFSIYKLFSPFINILFSIFYPIEVLLHFFGFGGVFDEVILKYLNIGNEYIVIRFPLVFILLFLILSIIALYKKWAFYGINIIAILSLIYLIGVWSGKV